ncbi:class I SAM-dependent methyltransferase [Winogradskyella sp.]|nr:class I SAM-dependent methyltransferase [Winogradskyella sp.]MDA8874516.1 class I SAM-dependent methyltransferase [Winogradskyella sp.]
MNQLEEYFNNNEKRIIHKWQHYFDIYDRHFRDYKNKDIVVLEIGVSNGGSLQMWKDYFGDKAKIYGIDINPFCKELEEENIEIFIGSQSDRKFLTEIKAKIPPVDILIDDGGHTMRQQIISYEELFSHIKPSGIYLCEDLQTSYKLNFGGGYKRNGTFIEYSKNFIDYLHAFHSNQRSLAVSNFTTSVNSVHYYDSVIVIEKKPRKRPKAIQSGNKSVKYPTIKETSRNKNIKKIKRKVTSGIEKILQALRIRSVFR